MLGVVRSVGSVLSSHGFAQSPQISADGATANIEVPLIAMVGNKALQGNQLVQVEKKVIATARTGCLRD
jgi:hypothetical protein